MGQNIGIRLFGKACGKLLQTPVSFLEGISSGSVVGELSMATDILDNRFAEAVKGVITAFFQITSVVILVSTVFPYFVLIFICLSIPGWYVSRKFLDIMPRLRVLESLVRSDTSRQLKEGVEGAVHIRTFDRAQHFTTAFDQSCSELAEVTILSSAMRCWASMRLDFIG